MSLFHKTAALKKVAGYLVILLAGLAVYIGSEKAPAPAVDRIVAEPGAAAIRQAYEQHRSGVWVALEGDVVRLLPDDNDGSRHQRFVLNIGGGHTLLVAHNIDLAPRIPLSISSRVSMRGRYEWNDKGGVLHWTHHDPNGEIAGGWIEFQGQRYQ